MKKVMLVGKIGAGKTTFKQALKKEEFFYKKTQALEVFGEMIDTPGEYMEHGKFQRALTVTAAEVDLILLFHDTTDPDTMFPPEFASMFNKKTVGIVTKVDLAQDPSEIQRARGFLEMAGAEEIFLLSSYDGTGLREIEAFLQEKNGTEIPGDLPVK